MMGGLFRRISKFPTLRSARSNKEVRLCAVSWGGGSVVGSVIFHFTHNLLLSPYIIMYAEQRVPWITP